MQTTPNVEPSGSPVPGVIPEPAHVHRQGSPEPASSRRRVPGLFAGLMGALHGDKHMKDAYPPAWRGSPAAERQSDSGPTAAAGEER